MPEEIELRGLHPHSSNENLYNAPKVTSRSYFITKLIVITVQISLVIGCFMTYEELFSISKYGAAAVVAGSMSGLSQGLLQSFTARQIQFSTIIKFYIWGIINGIWTKFWTDKLNSMFEWPPAKIISDQLLGNPFSIFLFLSFSAYWDGKDTSVYLSKAFISTVRTSLFVWPAASIAVFYFIPVEMIVPFNALVNLAWTVVLGLIV